MYHSTQFPTSTPIHPSIYVSTSLISLFANFLTMFPLQLSSSSNSTTLFSSSFHLLLSSIFSSSYLSVNASHQLPHTYNIHTLALTEHTWKTPSRTSLTETASRIRTRQPCRLSLLPASKCCLNRLDFAPSVSSIMRSLVTLKTTTLSLEQMRTGQDPQTALDETN